MLRSTYQASIGLFLLFISIPFTLAQTTMTYQGQLQDGTNLVDGETVEVFFELYDDPDPNAGTLVSDDGPFNVAVEDGLFQVDLDFGDVNYTVAKYLRIQVNGTWLDDTQEITSVPVAQYAIGAGGVQWTNVLNAPEFWRLGGNAGTDGQADFLGTTDATTFELRVDNRRALRVSPSGDDLYAPNVVLGHEINSVDDFVVGATISGGGNLQSDGNSEQLNHVTADYGTIGGGYGNRAFLGSTVGGGRRNRALGQAATVGGGWANEASGRSSTIPGGSQSDAIGDYSVAIGRRNDAIGNYSFAVGDSNSASGTSSSVGGGFSNAAAGNYSTIGGGSRNSASGLDATVPGGFENEANGEKSLAAGNRAHAEHDGAFVWADSVDQDFSSTGTNQFLIRAAGGVGVNEDSPLAALHVESATGEDALRVRIDGSTGLQVGENRGVSVGTTLDAPNRGLRVTGLLELRSIGAAGGSELCLNSNIVSYCNASSRQFKENIQPLEASSALIGRFRPVRFNWKESGRADIGLIAEEVAEVAPDLVEYDDNGEVRGVKYRQLSAVLISAVQQQSGLIAESRDRLAALEAENAKLHRMADRNRELEERLAALEALLLEDDRVARSE